MLRLRVPHEQPHAVPLEHPHTKFLSIPDTISYAYTNTLGLYDPSPLSLRLSNPNAHAIAHSHTLGQPDQLAVQLCNQHAHTYPLSHADPVAHRDSVQQRFAHADPYSHVYSDADPHAEPHTDTLPQPDLVNIDHSHDLGHPLDHPFELAVSVRDAHHHTVELPIAFQHSFGNAVSDGFADSHAVVHCYPDALDRASVQNVVARLDPQVPSIDLTVPETPDGSPEGPSVGVTSAFQDLQVGDDEATAISASNIAVRVENRTADITSGSTVETVIYSTVLPDSTTTFEQSFAFHTNATQSEFAQVGFSIGANTLKWSLNFTGGGQDRNSTVRYRLSTLTTTINVAVVSSTSVVTSRTNFPAVNMTTYFFPLAATASSTTSTRELAGRLVVFDVARVDGQIVPLVGHRVVLVPPEFDGQLPEYVLELTFPPFANSLYYDPAISMGQLMGSKSSKSSGGGDSSVMVIGAAVAIPIALVVIVAVAIGGVLYMRARRERSREASRRAMHAATMYHNATVSPPQMNEEGEEFVVYHAPKEETHNDLFSTKDEEDALPGC